MVRTPNYRTNIPGSSREGRKLPEMFTMFVWSAFGWGLAQIENFLYSGRQLTHALRYTRKNFREFKRRFFVRVRKNPDFRRPE